jgi:succinate dehydrogenase / fumarate reductase membrane anchor subunit
MLGIRPNGNGRQAGTLGWLLQRVAGVVVFGVVTFHLIVVHYTTPGEPITFAESNGRFGTGLYAGLWLALLAFALFHAAYGLRGILLDFVKVHDHRALDWALVLLGALVFGAGVLFALPLILGRPLL